MPSAPRARSKMCSASTPDRQAAAPRFGCAERLGLGTVQFGLDYGVTNAGGRVPADAVAAILDYARARGVRLLDTASLYGESEAVLGELSASAAFDIVTKTPKFGSCHSPAEAASLLRSGMDRSLSNLRADAVHGLLLHDAGDLLGPFGEALWRGLEDLRSQRLVAHIGASVYDGREIDTILGRYGPDIIQLPTNAVDLRLATGGQLDRLARRGVEVHARSIFLQGLLLQPPAAVEERFAAIRPSLAGLRDRFAAAGFSMMEGLIASVLSRRGIERIIVGCTSVGELAEIAAAVQAVGDRILDFDLDPFAIDDPQLLNPALWRMS